METLKFRKQQTIGNYMFDFVYFISFRQEGGRELFAGNKKNLFSYNQTMREQ
jgi:hypothetical protein